MSEPAPIEVVLLAPPRGHPLATALRTVVERVARREGVRYRERADDDGRVADGQGRALVRFVVGIEVGASLSDARPGPDPSTERIGVDAGRRPTPTLALGLAATEPDGAIWTVPEIAFGRPIDGLERVARLGSALGAALDLALAPDGHAHLEALIAAGPCHVLAGTAHLSGPVLADAVARQLASRAAAMLVAALDEDPDWEVAAWELPPELDVAAQREALEQAGGEAAGRVEALRQGALERAEALVAEVMAGVDHALATHGLAAVKPLCRALAGLAERAHETTHHAPEIVARVPSDLAVRARAAELAALPAPIPGVALTAMAWAGPSGVLTGVALGPLVDAPVAGAGHALMGALGAASFLGFAALGAARLGLARRRAARALHMVERDHAVALARLDHTRRAALAVDVVRPARAWLRAELAREADRLHALEAAVRALGRGAEGALAASANDSEVDVAVDLAPARALLDPSPAPLVQAARAELGPGWRDALPTLLDLRRAAERMAVGAAQRPPWELRADVAHALEAPLARALERVDAGLCRLVPRGLPVRRLRIAPPALSAALGTFGDAALPSRGDAHLVVSWRPS